MLSAAPLLRSGAAGGMLATSRLTGQTIGATIAAITFRLADHAELIALVVAALFAFAAALASLSRLRYENPVETSELRAPDAP
jgi:DHA2 family multidrug resistance protein-like MFS transporter